MWKIAVGFVVFAALAMFILTKSGGNIDMGGEKHGSEAVHEPAPAATAPASAPASAPAAPASNPASAASAANT
ncbi:MAG: hypothetical protein U1E84_10730 [Rhodoferax sp.]